VFQPWVYGFASSKPEGVQKTWGFVFPWKSIWVNYNISNLT
jgi:hypothetical protein